MLVAQSVGYIGQQLPNGYTGYAHEGDFFVAFSVEEGVTQESGEKLFQNFRNELHNLSVTNLSTFESQISNTFLKLNFPAHFNLAIGFIYKDVLYIKTVGKGQIYFRRGREFDLLMDGDKSASGYLQEYDLAIFTTAKVNELLGEVEDIKAFVDLNPPKEINEKLVNEGYAEEAQGFASIFVEFLSEETAELLPPPEDTMQQALVQTTENEETQLELAPPMKTVSEMREQGSQPVESAVPPVVSSNAPTSTEKEAPEESTISVTPPASAVTTPPPITSALNPEVPPEAPEAAAPTTPTVPPETIKPPSSGFTLPFLSRFQFRQSKKISLIVVVILFGILLWSVVFGYQRRMAAEMQKKVETTQTQIQANLTKAEEEAYLNFDESLALIEESKALLNALREEVGSSKEEEINNMAQLIEEAEAKIVKRDEKEAVEFYDLALEAENAQGDAVYLEGDTLAVLDKQNDTVYILSLDSKLIEKYTSAEVGAATHVSTYEDSVFILNPEKGIYEFTTATKVEQVIEAEGWGNITGIEIYNGNIYVLDEGNNDIYKYLVAESGYSDKTSYFTSAQPNLENSVGIAIDSAVYIAKETEVLKFLSGAADTFTTQYPEKTPSLSGIYTNSDIEQVYVWDSTAGIIYVLAKNGEYNRQVASGVLRNAKGVFVYDDEAYVFDGKKLYTVSLD